MDLTYKKATLGDIDLLTETRIIILKAANQLSDEVDMSEVRSLIIIIKRLCMMTAMLPIWSLMENGLLEPVVSVIFK